MFNGIKNDIEKELVSWMMKRYIKTLSCLLKWQAKNKTDLSSNFQL